MEDAGYLSARRPPAVVTMIVPAVVERIMGLVVYGRVDLLPIMDVVYHTVSRGIIVNSRKSMLEAIGCVPSSADCREELAGVSSDIP